MNLEQQMFEYSNIQSHLKISGVHPIPSKRTGIHRASTRTRKVLQFIITTNAAAVY